MGGILKFVGATLAWLPPVLVLAAAGAMPATSGVRAAGIYTSGALDCGLWVESRSKGTAGLFEVYLRGTMNGLAIGSSAEFWNANGSLLTPEQVYLWMDKFCRENPLSSVITGAVILIDEHTGGEYSRSRDNTH